MKEDVPPIIPTNAKAKITSIPSHLIKSGTWATVSNMCGRYFCLFVDGIWVSAYSPTIVWTSEKYSDIIDTFNVVLTVKEQGDVT